MLADAQIGAGQFQEARQSIDEAVKAGPQSAGASSSLAWLLATHWADPIRDGKTAIELARKACELKDWKNPDFLDTLAAAYAEAGQFDDAVKWEKKALEDPKAFNAAGLEQVKQRLKLYEARKPYHRPRPAAGTGRPEPGPGRVSPADPGTGRRSSLNTERTEGTEKDRETGPGGRASGPVRFRVFRAFRVP